MTEVCSCSLREAQNRINRSWKPFITKSEFILLGWILERTYAFKKTSEVIPLRHFLEGITSGGEVICYPVSMSRATLVRAITSLQAKNLLSVTRPGHGNCRYEILLDQDAANVCATAHGEHSTAHSEHSTAHGEHLASRPRALCARKVYNNTIRVTRDLEPMKLNTPPRSASAGVVVDRLKAIAVRTAAVKQVKLSAGKFSALELYYREQMQSSWPQAPLPGMRLVDKVRFRQAFLSGTNYDPRSFIEFVVGEWGRIMKREFPKWRTPPFPELGFISVHRGRLLADYTNAYLAVNARQLQGREEDPDKLKDLEIANLKRQLTEANSRADEKDIEAATYHARLMRRDNAR